MEQQLIVTSVDTADFKGDFTIKTTARVNDDGTITILESKAFKSSDNKLISEVDYKAYLPFLTKFDNEEGYCNILNLFRVDQAIILEEMFDRGLLKHDECLNTGMVFLSIPFKVYLNYYKHANYRTEYERNSDGSENKKYIDVKTSLTKTNTDA